MVEAEPGIAGARTSADTRGCGEPRAQYYPVTAEAVRNLAAFLRATGWTCLYGIGMGTNTPEHAAEEAEYVAKTLGERLQYFQIGNAGICATRTRGTRKLTLKNG